MTTETMIFERGTEIREEYYAAAAKKGWPQDVLRTASELRVEKSAIEWWLTHEQPTLEEIQRFLQQRRQLMYGTMHARQAGWNDGEALADLYANSPEEIGDWEVTVERSPYSYAQFRLQEHVAVSVLEDRGVILAATADSSRNTLVGGEKTTVHIASAWRVRREFRGKGLSRMLRQAAGPPTSWFGFYNYYYIRSQNFAAMKWIESFIPESVKAPQREGDVPGIPVTVHHFAPVPFAGHTTGIRLATPGDIEACLRLINRTHAGCDLFRPYTRDYLEERLYDPCWGDKPDFWIPVYGWSAYHVVEEGGEIVACGGLWDKGEHVREVWRHKATGESQTFDCTALLDYGLAEGREDAMARLIAYFSAKTRELKRTYLVAAIEHLPDLVATVAGLKPETEARALHWQLYNKESDNWEMDSSLNRIYTDLAYW